MRKYLIVALSVLFVMGTVGSAFAIHADIPAESQAVVAKGATKIHLGGEVRIRGEFKQNTTDFNKDKADHYAAYDQRVRLSTHAQVTPNTEGQILISAGDGNGVDPYTWGANATPATASSYGKGIYPVGESKRGQIQIVEAWILHKGSGLLGIPAGIKVGHMPLILGNGLFFNHTLFGDDAIVLFANPTKELEVALLTAKFAEGTTTANDDSNGYVGLFTYKLNKDTNFSGDVTYVDDQANGYASKSTVSAAAKGTHLWNFGLRGDTNIAGFGLKADVELQAGKSKSVTGATGTGTTGDISNRGYAVMLGASYKLAPVTVSLDYAYGSGDDNATDNKNKTFVTATTATPNYTYVYDYRAPTAYGSANAGISNTQYVKLGLASDFTKELSGNINAYILRAAKKRVITLGTATTKGDSKSIGTEIDAKIAYKLDRNLTYWVEGGYLYAGAFYDTATKSSDNAYAVRHGIQLSF
ncbi:MAG: alginate export family protein [Nitrospirae bacterium]|nr:alginate export family protein [Nitrospirota bacterium]